MTFRYTATIVAALLSVTVTPTSAQGDPEALVAGTINNPTSSWQQWQPKPTYALEDLPQQYMGANRIPGGGEAQSGWNQCANDTWNQKSLCQTAYINDLQDWCIWGPPEGGDIGSTERVAVAYCTTKKHGTRLIPDGTITGAHFVSNICLMVHSLGLSSNVSLLSFFFSLSFRRQIMCRSQVWVTFLVLEYLWAILVEKW